MKNVLHLKVGPLLPGVFESGTTSSFLSQESNQGSVIQSFPGSLFPLGYYPSLPHTLIVLLGLTLIPVSSPLEATQRAYSLDPSFTKFASSYASSHASSANPFAHANTTDVCSAQGRPDRPPHLNLSCHPLRPWPLQRSHRLLRSCDPHRSHLMPSLNLATWFKRHASV